MQFPLPVTVLLGSLRYFLPVLFGLLAIQFGQDANWDLRNYHLYIPYAFLENRLGWDVAPSQVANFYNPLLYVPFYLGLRILPVKTMAFLIGFLQGANGLLLWKIGDRLLPPGLSGRSGLLMGVTLLGLTGALFLSELGTSFADTVLSLFVLGSLWLNLVVLDGFHTRKRSRTVFLVVGAGLLVGLAVGLKQPLAVYAVGLCSAFLLANLSWPTRVGLAFGFGCGVLLGISFTGGFWLLEMWNRYGNPLFPYFNDFFESEWGVAGSYRDERFLPRTLFDVLLFPFSFALAPLRTAEIAFRDFRIPLFAVLLLAAALHRLQASVRRLPGRAEQGMANSTLYFFAFCLLTFLVWLRLFAIGRYLVVAEMVAPLGILLLLMKSFGQSRGLFAAASAVALFLLCSTQPGNWGRVGWSSPFLEVAVPSLREPENTLVLLAGTDPQAYVIPFFPKEVRFLRIESYFIDAADTESRFARFMRQVVTTHQGPVFALYREYEKEAMSQALAAYGLQLDQSSPVELASSLEKPGNAPLLFAATRKK